MDVRIERDGRCGRLRLDRPRALNALTAGMCRAMLEALKAWRDDPGIDRVLIDHAEGRGFCAGADIRRLAEAARSGGAEAEVFFRVEYQLDEFLRRYPKPVAVSMDGVTMGGGAGLAFGAAVRIATERTVFAMPEAAIGLFPDVGSTYVLSRLPGRIGRWAALTGARLAGADCLALGLATVFAPSGLLDEAVGAWIAEGTEIAGADPGPSAVLALRPRIDRLFAADRTEAVLAALDADGSDVACEAARRIRAGSPTTHRITERLFAFAERTTDFADQMRQEYRIAVRRAASDDFVEGVRTAMIDRGDRPAWRPDALEGVSRRDIDLIFAPLAPEAEWEPAA